MQITCKQPFLNGCLHVITNFRTASDKQFMLKLAQVIAWPVFQSISKGKQISSKLLWYLALFLAHNVSLWRCKFAMWLGIRDFHESEKTSCVKSCKDRRAQFYHFTTDSGHVQNWNDPEFPVTKKLIKRHRTKGKHWSVGFIWIVATEDFIHKNRTAMNRIMDKLSTAFSWMFDTALEVLIHRLRS